MYKKPLTIKELLEVTTDYLKKKEIENPRLSAEILLAHQLGINRVKLYVCFDQPLNTNEITGYRSLIKRRLNREPIQYITGRQEFWSLDFIVGPQVLIPRPESELLVESVISLFKEGRLPQSGHIRILDLGTGCGAISISLARELNGASFWASDISQGALKTAGLNAQRHGVEDKIQFILGDLLRPFKAHGATFDIILSNPPYIASDAFKSLPPEVRDHEPKLALDGRREGMFFIEKIIMEGADYLKLGGWILMEMDPLQTTKALRLIEESNHYSNKERIKDFSRRYRVVLGQKTV